MHHCCHTILKLPCAPEKKKRRRRLDMKSVVKMQEKAYFSLFGTTDTESSKEHLFKGHFSWGIYTPWLNGVMGHPQSTLQPFFAQLQKCLRRPVAEEPESGMTIVGLRLRIWLFTRPLGPLVYFAPQIHYRLNSRCGGEKKETLENWLQFFDFLLPSGGQLYYKE